MLSVLEIATLVGFDSLPCHWRKPIIAKSFFIDGSPSVMARLPNAIVAQ